MDRRVTRYIPAALVCWAFGPWLTAGDSIKVGIIGDQTGTGDLEASYQVLRQGVEALKGLAPDVVLHTGDLLESTESPDRIEARFGQAVGILDGLPAKWYLSAGDHDVNPPLFQQNSPDRSREALFQRLYSAINPRVADHLYYSFDLRGYHFIALDSLEHPNTDPRWGNVFYSRIGDEQFAWLSSDLEEAKNSDGIVVFLHQPLWYNWSGWERVHALLKRYPTRAVIAGHFHYNQSDSLLDGIQYWVVGATGGKTKQGNPNSGDLQHVTLLEISDAGISFRLVPLPPFSWTRWTERGVMDRLQSDDVVLGNLWDFAMRSPVYWEDGRLVRQCGSQEPAQLVVANIGNASELPSEIRIGVLAEGIEVTQATFGAGLCQGPPGKFDCLLKPSANVAASNPSVVQVADPDFPVWTGRLAAQGIPQVGAVIRAQVLLSFNLADNYMVYAEARTTVRACD